MRIAILGTRGIPANYGGFETFAEELSVRLAARGHDVTVYCRSGAEPHSTYGGVRLRYLSTIRHKYFDTIAHTFVSTLHLLAHRVDVALYCNGANAIFTAVPRLFGMPVALNVDGLEPRLAGRACGRPRETDSPPLLPNVSVWKSAMQPPKACRISAGNAPAGRVFGRQGSADWPLRSSADRARARPVAR